MNIESIGRPENDQSGQIKNKRLVFHRFCPFHVVTFIDDCLRCNERCIPLQNVIGPELEALIPKELRDELYEYLFAGDDNPLIKIRELTGIPIRVDIKAENPLLSPKRISYLSEMNENDERRHWILYYKGYMAWRSIGDMRQGGFIVEQIPDDMKKCIAYYQAHTAIMQGKIRPEQAIDKIDTSNIDTSSHPSELEFENSVEATRILVTKASEMIKQVSSGRLEQNNDKENEINAIENNCRKILEEICKIKSNTPDNKKQNET
jgi:hypothetical protein